MNGRANRPEQRSEMTLRREERKDEQVRITRVDDAREPILDIVEREPLRERGPFLLAPSDGPRIEEARLREDRTKDFRRFLSLTFEDTERIGLVEPLLQSECAICFDDL